MTAPTQEFLARLRALRRDLGGLLFHLTRTPNSQTPPLRQQVFPPRAADSLRNMLSERRVVGTSGFIRGGYRCVCFSESPVGELVSLFRLAELTAEGGQRPRYEPYGIGVRREWLFARGGRPVIYQADTEYEQLPESLRYRHVRYEPNNGIDFTWEREWRIRTDELTLDPQQTLVIVPSSQEAFDIMYDTANWEADYDDEGNPEFAYPRPRWMAVSLDLFGLGEFR